MSEQIDKLERAIATQQELVAKIQSQPASYGQGYYGVYSGAVERLNTLQASLNKVKEIRVLEEDARNSQSRTSGESKVKLRNILVEEGENERSVLKTGDEISNQVLGQKAKEDVATMSNIDLAASLSGVDASTLNAPAPEATPEATPEAAPAAPAPAAATPAPAAPATPPATPPPIPTPADVSSMEDELESERDLRDTRAKAEKRALEDAQREKDRILRDEAYNRMTPAERLQENVRERESRQMANAAGAVAERREQMAADEAYKAKQVAEQGYFREGDTTQFVGQADREAMQKYFNERAANLRLDNSKPIAGGRTSGARPTSNDGLTVINIPEEYGGGLATGAKPNFGKEYRPPLTDKVEYDFGEDPNKMYSDVSADGRRATPIMTSAQAQATDLWREGSGINVANTAANPNDPNDWKRAMDAKDAQRIRDAERKRMIDSQIAYALTGKTPARTK
jgi:hypothetical protein